MKRPSRVAAWAACMAAACLGVVPAGAVGAAQDPVTSVDTLSAAASGGRIAVTGTATFVDVPQVVGTDPGDDAAPLPLPGTDITAAAISRAPGSDTLTFTLGLKDMSVTGGGAPGYVYRWHLSVDGHRTGLTLEAAESPFQMCRATQGEGEVSAGPVFRIVKTFATVAWLEGSFADNTVTFEGVPLDIIGASAGSRINTAGRLGVYTTEAIDIPFVACQYITDPTLVGDVIEVDDYVVPGASVQLGLAPANTPESEIPLTTAATVGEDDSSFSATLPIPEQPGEYIVIATACYIPDSCGTKLTAVTIPS